MSPKTEEQNEEIRREKSQLILETALELFAENGYHATSISKIASSAGISKGLIYNYFTSKEDLLQSIFHQVMDKLSLVMSPTEKTEYTKEESEAFFENIFKLLTENPKEWKLFYQLSFQSDVMEILLKNLHEHTYDASQKAMLQYFSCQNYKDPEVAILLFSSITKGFVLQYAFAPEMFNEDLLNRFKNKLKDLFINTVSRNKDSSPIELDEKLGYFLL